MTDRAVSRSAPWPRRPRPGRTRGRRARRSAGDAPARRGRRPGRARGEAAHRAVAERLWMPVRNPAAPGPLGLPVGHCDPVPGESVGHGGILDPVVLRGWRGRRGLARNIAAAGDGGRHRTGRGRSQAVSRSPGGGVARIAAAGPAVAREPLAGPLGAAATPIPTAVLSGPPGDVRIGRRGPEDRTPRRHGPGPDEDSLMRPGRRAVGIVTEAARCHGRSRRAAPVLRRLRVLRPAPDPHKP